MVEQRFHDNGLLEDFLDGREVFIGGFGLFLGGAAEDDIVETVMAGRPEGVWFDENAFRTELLDGRQLESDFEMPPLIDPRIAAEKRLAIDLQVVTFARCTLEIFRTEHVAVADAVFVVFMEPCRVLSGRLRRDFAEASYQDKRREEFGAWLVRPNIRR